MTAPCVTCGGEVEPMSEAMRAAKVRCGLPLTPAKRCSSCVWWSLIAFANAPDEDEDEVPEKGEECICARDSHLAGLPVARVPQCPAHRSGPSKGEV